MSSVFTGKSGLRSQYRDLTATALNSATDATSALLLAKATKGARMTFIDNATNADMAILLVHPEGDSTVVADRLFWLEIPAGRVVNFDTSSAPSLEIDPGTTIYAHKVSGTASSGKLRIILWG